ncbi:MAG: S1 RNA-binding domain-containing protein [Myxococcota bacterium]|nr:S1 RNA-binding domain-containing protein [Myxococcota bacterium]
MNANSSSLETYATIDQLYLAIEERTFQPGSLIKGAVDGIDGEFAKIKLTSGSGLVPKAEVDGLDPANEHLFFVESQDAEGVRLSYHKALRLSLWNWLTACQKNGSAVSATIVGEARGGLAVEVHGVKATMSLMDLEPGSSRELSDLIGKTMDVRVTSIREKKAQIQVSQRALTEGDRSERKEFTLANLDVGQIVEGEVRRLANFGAFVDIGGVDGLLHVKDMQWKRVDHPRDFVSVGDLIKVKVLRFDSETEKIALGTKQLLPDPWSDAEERYRAGKEVNGDVVGLTDFGAFVMLDDGIEGLVHVSEMSWTEKIARSSDVLKKGQPVKAWVIRCDIERRRLGLTLKSPDENPWKKLKERHPIGDKIPTKVTSTVEFGLFVSLGDGLEGLVHISDFAWGPMTATPSELYSVGDDIEVMLLDVDEERGRANLGLKQLSDPAQSATFEDLEIGATIECGVSSVQSYGVFVELENGIEGMIHVSAFGDKLSNPVDELVTGQRILADVTAIDKAEGRVSLAFNDFLPTSSDADLSTPEVSETESIEAETKSDDAAAVVDENDGSVDPQEAQSEASAVPAVELNEDAQKSDSDSPLDVADEASAGPVESADEVAVIEAEASVEESADPDQDK